MRGERDAQNLQPSAPACTELRAPGLPFVAAPEVALGNVVASEPFDQFASSSREGSSWMHSHGRPGYDAITRCAGDRVRNTLEQSCDRTELCDGRQGGLVRDERTFSFAAPQAFASTIPANTNDAL